MPLIECVPNFSEGRRGEVIARIADRLREVSGALLLDVDAGADVNRTVMTVVGTVEAVEDAVFRAVGEAARQIDLRRHRGAHPRIGATDVCPFVPLADLTLADCAAVATRFAARVGVELAIPCYLYGAAARQPGRRELAALRRGGYEALGARLAQPAWQPDFGPAGPVPSWGATAIGARAPLIAYNVNLETDDLALARNIASEVREHSRVPGSGLPGCRALGWYLAEYGCCQVTVNVLRHRELGLDRVFRRVQALAAARGVRVCSSELIGMVPKGALLAAGWRSLHPGAIGEPPSDAEREEARLVRAAVAALGLDARRPFDPTQKVLEYRIAALLGPQAPQLEI